MSIEKQLVLRAGTEQKTGFGFKVDSPLDNRVILKFDPRKDYTDDEGNKGTVSIDENETNATFIVEDLRHSYVGMIVTIVDDYPAKSASVTLRLDSKNNSNIIQKWTWTELSTGGDLTNYYTKGEVDGLITSVYKYKGTCAYADLPKPEGEIPPVLGDVWNVTDSVNVGGKIIPAGTNWAWDGNKWDALGGDVSNYLTKPTAQGTKGQILTLTDNEGNYAWQDAPISTSVAVGATVAEVGGYTVVVPTTKQDKVRTIKQSDDKQVDVYSKDIIDAVITAIKAETSDLYWNSIP